MVSDPSGNNVFLEKASSTTEHAQGEVGLDVFMTHHAHVSVNQIRAAISTSCTSITIVTGEPFDLERGSKWGNRGRPTW